MFDPKVYALDSNYKADVALLPNVSFHGYVMVWLRQFLYLSIYSSGLGV